MKFKRALPKVICVLGGLALLVPLLTYAAGYTLYETGSPNGGSWPTYITTTITWSWNVANTGNTPSSPDISATANCKEGNLKKVIPLWFDETRWTFGDYTQNSPTPIPSLYKYNTGQATTYWWNASYTAPASHASATYNAGNYYLRWNAWNATASDGTSASRNSGNAGQFSCQ